MKTAVIEKRSKARTDLINELNFQFDRTNVYAFRDLINLYDEFANSPLDVILLSLDEMDVPQQMANIQFATKCWPLAKVVVMRETFNRTITPRYFRTGASGYLPAKSVGEELGECMKVVSAGMRYIPTELLVKLL
ncbi:hypothetical protein [Dyadobacter sp. OTU695]|uniref:hypothetical protein n=1 Tax=Dyadobacter sp. OTU695 TaxID=3043860 RepID=UPI00313CEE96